MAYTYGLVQWGNIWTGNQSMFGLFETNYRLPVYYSRSLVDKVVKTKDFGSNIDLDVFPV